MARDVSIAEALAALAATEGFELTDAQKQLAAKVSRDQMTDAAVTVFGRKLRADALKSNGSTKYANRAFDLAKMIAKDVKGKNGNKGRGVVYAQTFEIETPDGRLNVSLINDERKDAKNELAKPAADASDTADNGSES